MSGISLGWSLSSVATIAAACRQPVQTGRTLPHCPPPHSNTSETSTRWKKRPSVADISSDSRCTGANTASAAERRHQCASASTTDPDHAGDQMQAKPQPQPRRGSLRFSVGRHCSCCAPPALSAQSGCRPCAAMRDGARTRLGEGIASRRRRRRRSDPLLGARKTAVCMRPLAARAY